jgi:hypothetical protein
MKSVPATRRLRVQFCYQNLSKNIFANDKAVERGDPPKQKNPLPKFLGTYARTRISM